jgi:hypothetical protein
VSLSDHASAVTASSNDSSVLNNMFLSFALLLLFKERSKEFFPSIS